MSCSINPQDNMDLNQCYLAPLIQIGGPSLNGWWVIARTSSNWVNFDFEVKFDLEGQGQSPPKTIGILTKVTYGPNLVILAWTGDELSHGQTWWRTDGRTDGQTQATTIPEGQYWPRVKIYAGVWPFRYVALPVCGRFGLWMVCGLWPFPVQYGCSVVWIPIIFKITIIKAMVRLWSENFGEYFITSP